MRFSLDLDVQPETVDLDRVAAGWGILPVRVTGFLATDVVEQMVFTAKPKSGGAGDMIEKTITSAARADGQITVPQLEPSARLGRVTLTAADVATIAAGDYEYSVRVFVTREAQLYYRDVQVGEITALAAVGSAAALLTVASVTITGDPVQGAPGTTAQLTATARDAQNVIVPGAVVSWSSSNPLVAQVDANGLVTFVSPGVTTITALCQGMQDTAQATTSDPAFVAPANGDVATYVQAANRWEPRSIAAALALVGGLLGATAVVGSNAEAGRLVVNGPVSQRFVEIRTAGVKRWEYGADATAEGANSGSDFVIRDYNDGGGNDTVFRIVRGTSTTGRITLARTLRWSVDNTWDLGDPANFRPRSIYAASNVVAGGMMNSSWYEVSGIKALGLSGSYNALYNRDGDIAVMVRNNGNFYAAPVHTFRAIGGNTDSNITLALGEGGATPTANRTVQVQLDAPSGPSGVGNARFVLSRAGASVWFFGIDSTSSGAKSSNTDYFWSFGSTNVAALTSAAVLRLGAAASPSLDLVSSTATTGRAYRLTSDGSTGDLIIQDITSGGGVRWRVTSAGHWHAHTDAALNIGAPTANRPASVYIATSLHVADLNVSRPVAGQWALVPGDGLLNSTLYVGGGSTAPTISYATQLIIRVPSDGATNLGRAFLGFMRGATTATQLGLANTVSGSAASTAAVSFTSSGGIPVWSLEPATGSTRQSGSLYVGGGAGFNGNAPVGKQAVGAAAVDLASVIALANNLRTALNTIGLTQA